MRKKLQRMLCVIDPTTSAQPAMLRAAWLAGKTGAELELLICYYNEYLSGERLFDAPSLEKAREEILAGHRERLDALAEPLRESGLTVHTTATWDHPLHESIVRHAAATGADLVFKDTHHHSTISRAFLTHTDWNLIRSCASPLWLVKPRDLPPRLRVVASVDPLHEHDKPASLDDRILGLGKALVETCDAELRAFHACDPTIAIASASASAWAPAASTMQELDERLSEEHRRTFDEFCRKHEIAKDRSELAFGPVDTELPAYCKEIDAAAVIMGAVSRNLLQRLFVGATAERTLEQLPCDLIIVKPDWYEKSASVDSSQAA